MGTIELPTEVVYAGREICGELRMAESREILITNGIGGYGSLTLASSLTRSYHGLLIAALRPPLNRTLLLSKLNETVRYRDQSYHLYTDRRKRIDFRIQTTAKDTEDRSTILDKDGQALMRASANLDPCRSVSHVRSTASASAANTDGRLDEVVIPEGFKLLESFHLTGTVPVFRYTFRDAILEKKVWMKHGQNTVYVTYDLRRASQPVQLRLEALVNHRSHHARTSATDPHFDYSATVGDGGSCVAVVFTKPDHQQTTLTMMISSGCAELANEWETGFVLSEERSRGLPHIDDNWHAATFVVDLPPGRQITFVATAENEMSHLSLDGESELELHHAYEKLLLQNFLDARITSMQRRSDGYKRSRVSKGMSSICSTRHGSSDTWRNSRTENAESNIKQLVLAADQFIISRGAGHSIVAGFHWFTDWARDTMISVHGLTIVTGQYDVCKKILQTFSTYVSKGMLPNRFPDDGSAPTEGDYNNVDGTLWYFESVRSYYSATTDAELLGELYPVLRRIIEYHCSGTRFGIKQDSDGLLQAGVEGLALTWMDAKTDVVYTQRDGKAVEIAALWFNALKCMADFAYELGHKEESDAFHAMAERTEQSFQKKFWNHAAGCCFDVIEGGPMKAEKETSIRPNQLIAASLSWSPLTAEQRALVVEACSAHLLTPNSVRSLSPDDESYNGVYHGDLFSRDRAYHQGVGWAWLLGPFILAHLRVHGNKTLSREFMLPILRSHLNDAGVGQVSELFDGDPPHRAKGCIAQAWSVAELLRAWAATEPDADEILCPSDEIV